ncbi:3-dehydroquinate synthase [Clostridium sp.]|uniref:3-dehydroquinate synthase n=1 Tax=Clostridium sp. TaxID=1506 RepID=UPI002FC7B753
MKELIVNADNSSCKIYLDHNIETLESALGEHKITTNHKFFVITDDNIYGAYKEKLEGILKKYNYKIFIMKHGEDYKSYETVKDIYEFLLKNDGDRNSIIIAFGGGIVGDISGYVAATYMRGIKYINIPTTLMSMVDSSIGGKVAYNFNGIKNLIGTFYNPIFIFISVEFLKTLPRNEVINGFSEVIKHGLLKDKNLLKYCKDNLNEIVAVKNDKLIYIIERCIDIKNEIVKRDYKDNDFRNVLNFGHTIGHGIEVISNHQISHGYAVALGILVELKISEYMMDLDEEVYNEMEKLFHTIGFPTKYKVDNMNMFMYAINHDKKNTNNNINFSLLEDVEKPITKVIVSDKVIRESIRESIERR